MEITYHWEGDYLIPDLKLSDTTEYYIGKYGRMTFFRRKPQGHLFLYAFVGNFMEASCGD